MKQLLLGLIALTLALIMAIGLSGCESDDDNSVSDEPSRGTAGNAVPGETPKGSGNGGTAETGRDDNAPIGYSPNQTWAIYWYLCGSDLETKWGCATEDLQEMMAVSLPDNIQVVILTGGSKQWQNDIINPNVLSLCHYDSDGFGLINTFDQANMGEPETLRWFLSLCAENFPADRQAAIIWDHGGGSIYGLACDENFGMMPLTLEDLEGVFESLDMNFELVGFDACLMATLDTAGILSEYSNWMVASEETEPGCGWNYTGILEGLSANPAMHGGEFGRIICDTYYEGCVDIDSADDVTLSVVDLSQIDGLLSAFDEVGVEALRQAASSPTFFSEFGRAARNAENYGGNSRTEGYTNMVDLGDLVSQAVGLLPDSGKALLAALDNAVYYKVNGPYRSFSSGISCFYTYDSDYDSYSVFADLGTSPAFTYYYEYELTGQPADDLYDYLSGMETEYWDDWEDWEEPSYVEAPDSNNFEDFPLEIENGDTAVLNLGPELAEQLVGVYFNIAIYDPEDGLVVFLGMDSDIDANWEDGVFMDGFIGEWCAIDGAFMYMDVSDETEEYVLYKSPILLNGEEYALSIAYDVYGDEYIILGARQEMSENGMASKNLRKLVPGDIVEPLFYVIYDIENSDDIEQLSVDSITVTPDTKIIKEDMGDETYLFLFEMWDYRGNSYQSELLFFTIEDGEIQLGG